MHLDRKFEELCFWGKITGEENDYFICFGLNFEGRYGFSGKEFYFAPSNTFKFELLPETYPYNDEDFKNSYTKPLKGKPEEIIKKIKKKFQKGRNQRKKNNKKEKMKKENLPTLMQV